MEHTFMTIHNLTPEANVLFASESIVDILGYQPRDIVGRACFDYFHPDEVPFARSVHSRGVRLDKAAVLHYARIRARDGGFVSCECCFTIVHDVLVACTSIYRRGEKSERRALEAPQIRRIFSCSPRDPRYHMLEHLSPKFRMDPVEREPRAALILNRFTRTLTVMYATNAVSAILGVSPDELKDKSFYECIQRNCLADAASVIESAKANDSIAYLRFMYRDPRRDEDFDDDGDDEDDDDDNAVPDYAQDHDMMDADAAEHAIHDHASVSTTDSEPGGASLYAGRRDPFVSPGGVRLAASSSSVLTPSEPSSSWSARATTATAASSMRQERRRASRPPSEPRGRRLPSFELEAVVSCTSDGLVVVLRHARPPVPTTAPHPPLVPSLQTQLDLQRRMHANGFFAAPWGEQPIRPHFPHEMYRDFRAPLLPQYMPLREGVNAAGGPPRDRFMTSIREVAVFAWALVGINGHIAAYARGPAPPQGAPAVPPGGLPIWDPNAGNTGFTAPENQAAARWAAAGPYARPPASHTQQPPPPAPQPAAPPVRNGNGDRPRYPRVGHADDDAPVMGRPWAAAAVAQGGDHAAAIVDALDSVERRHADEAAAAATGRVAFAVPHGELANQQAHWPPPQQQFPLPFADGFRPPGGPQGQMNSRERDGMGNNDFGFGNNMRWNWEKRRLLNRLRGQAEGLQAGFPFSFSYAGIFSASIPASFLEQEPHSTAMSARAA